MGFLPQLMGLLSQGSQRSSMGASYTPGRGPGGAFPGNTPVGLTGTNLNYVGPGGQPQTVTAPMPPTYNASGGGTTNGNPFAGNPFLSLLFGGLGGNQQFYAPQHGIPTSPSGPVTGGQQSNPLQSLMSLMHPAATPTAKPTAQPTAPIGNRIPNPKNTLTPLQQRLSAQNPDGSVGHYNPFPSLTRATARA